MKNNIYIFGAHSRARTLAEYLLYLHPETAVEAYLYDDNEENPSQIGGIKVISLDEEASLCTDYPVYIATRGASHQRISNHLKERGFTQICQVTPDLDLRLRNEYMSKRFAAMGRQFIKIDMLKARTAHQYPSKENPAHGIPYGGEGLSCNEGFSRSGELSCIAIPSGRGGLPCNAIPSGSGDLPGSDVLSQRDYSVAIYVAVSGHDKPLRQSYSLAPYEKTILSGAAIRGHSLPETAAADNLGDNISCRNRQFSELTALYWLWKHAGEDIIGMVHYRRHFILPEDWVARMQENDVDVILPVPLYVAPNLEENYKARHDPTDWDYMMTCLKKRSIQECNEADEFFQKGLYSPCNMFIMRKTVLDALCEWLFPILFAVAEHGGEKEDSYLNRYPGFLSERLMTFFFHKNREKHKVVYADKNFLE